MIITLEGTKACPLNAALVIGVARLMPTTRALKESRFEKCILEALEDIEAHLANADVARIRLKLQVGGRYIFCVDVQFQDSTTKEDDWGAVKEVWHPTIGYVLFR